MRLSDLAHYIPIPPHGQMPNGAGSCNMNPYRYYSATVIPSDRKERSD
jgi:hypothetical protein